MSSARTGARVGAAGTSTAVRAEVPKANLGGAVRATTGRTRTSVVREVAAPAKGAVRGSVKKLATSRPQSLGKGGAKKGAGKTAGKPKIQKKVTSPVGRARVEKAVTRIRKVAAPAGKPKAALKKKVSSAPKAKPVAKKITSAATQKGKTKATGGTSIPRASGKPLAKGPAKNSKVTKVTKVTKVAKITKVAKVAKVKPWWSRYLKTYPHLICQTLLGHEGKMSRTQLYQQFLETTGKVDTAVRKAAFIRGLNLDLELGLIGRVPHHPLTFRLLIPGRFFALH